MITTKKMPWLRLLGWAALAHIILLALSFLEVFIYSFLINPGQDQSFYEAHARISAPYVAILLGIPLFYLIARNLARKYGLEIRIGIWLAVFYVILDFLMLIPNPIDWSAHWWIFLLSFLTKLGAALWGSLSVRKRKKV